jgi:small GTP-binding protein
VGKTSFIKRAIYDAFDDGYTPATIEDALRWQYHETPYEIWDTRGDENLTCLVFLWMRAVDVALLFFDITSRASFEEMPSWFEMIQRECPGSGVMVIGTKSDLGHLRAVSAEEAGQFAAAQGFGYAGVSSKTGDGMAEVLAEIHSTGRNLRRFVAPELLWRGGRDGFSAEAFHRSCDGRGQTLTLIRDTGGNVFGCFAFPSWESSFFSKRKSDPTSDGFLFTLKNPHNLPPQRFRLTRGQQSSAIKVSSRICSCFGDDDLFICGGCDANPSHSRGFGSTYENTTGIDGRLVFAGSDTFIVDEIEVYWICRKRCAW